MHKNISIFAKFMRKQLLTYFFFTVYLLAMVKPILPLLDYYLNYNYIATKLCENRDKPILDCNGKCYVAKEIEKNKKENHQDTVVLEFKMDFYISNDLEFITFIENSFLETQNNRIPVTRELNWYNSFLFSVFHPPRNIV